MDIAKSIYSLTSQFPRDEVFGLTSQMKRAAVSVASNIAQGSQRGTSKDFAHFLSIAKGSLSELETQLLLSKDLKFCEEHECESIMKNIDELGMMIFSFKKKLLSSN